MNDVAKKLQAPFADDEYEWRVQSETKNGDKVNVLCYVTARAIMNRLDEVFGPLGWQTSYKTGPDGGVICDLSVYDADKSIWVHKEDGAENTNIEAVKGGISGALKRAGSAWGIGRLLYKLESNYVPLKDRGEFWHKTKGGKFMYWDAPALPDWAVAGKQKPGTKKQPKKTDTKKESDQDTETPREKFRNTLNAICEKQKLVKPTKTKFAAQFFIDSLCSVTGVADIAANLGFSLPEPCMMDKPEHSGWWVLCELIETLGTDLKIYTVMANQAKPEGDNQ